MDGIGIYGQIKPFLPLVNLVIIPVAIYIFKVGRHIGRQAFIINQILRRCCLFNGVCPIRQEDREVLWQGRKPKSGVRLERRSRLNENAIWPQSVKSGGN